MARRRRCDRDGAVVVLNLSYGRDLASDMDDARRWAERHGWAASHSQPFTLWDGQAFVLRA